ncbi:MAG: D-glycero-beta-D-manno-heptose 1,7-bisphosphate 7-phosphatase [Burkholderiaceae bacterium]
MQTRDKNGKSGSDSIFRRAAFLDRDGVINIDHAYVYQREAFDFVPGVLTAARALHEAGFVLVVVTNQSGIGRGRYHEADFQSLTDWMRAEFSAAGAPLAGVYFCPHHPNAASGAYRRDCDCRKPAPGMLLAAAHDLSLDLAGSVMFGDKPSDLEAAAAAGVPMRVLLGTDGRATPDIELPAALASARFASLAEAVASPWFARISAHSKVPR